MALPGPLVLTPNQAPRFNPGRHMMDGDSINTISAMVGSNEAGKTATAGGGRATAYNIQCAMTQFSVVATGADSCVLPKSVAGMRCVIQNDGAASLQVFANGSDTINATAGATGVALANGATAEYVCVVAGSWKRIISS
jgi:hypothetical protein